MSDRTDDLAAAAARHLRALAAAPRFTGSAEASAARAYCARELNALGFVVTEHGFSYSRFVGCYATPTAGVWSASSVGVATWLAFENASRAAFAILLLSLAVLAAFSIWASRRGVMSFPALRARGVNLVAKRSAHGAHLPHDERLVWLVAHVDSKSQRVTMLTRIASVVLLIVGWLAMIVLGAIDLLMNVPNGLWLVASISAIVGSAGLIATIVGNASPGAVDNASGVATVLLAASMLPRDANVGVIFTDAEELGLAGALAITREESVPRGIVLNVDGVDDAGELLVMTHGSRSTVPAAALARAHARLADRGETTLVVRRLLPGVLVDSLAFVDAGWQGVTLSRGTARTLRRIHTKADGLERLSGAGVPLAARVLAATALELI